MSATILLVEDNEQNRYLATFLLEQEGFRVVHARNGHEAIEAAIREKPALVLTDIQIPKMDGYEVAHQMRITPGCEEIPIVAVTSYAMAGDRERAIAQGFVGYIEKPIETETFVATIRRFLPKEEFRI
jgi:two-component system, cell cycle response regulator DivK